ncbi:MAG: DNA replication/repair protein RecF [Candidatus Limnocylindria bacterium]
MRALHLTLEDFRNYDAAEVDLVPGVTAFVGANGAGKTNLLEALYLCARGESPRAREDPELVRWGRSLARIRTHIARSDGERRVELLFFAAMEGERRRQRRYLLDGAPKRGEDTLGELTVVAFFPEDVQLLGEAPSVRRRYLDAMVGQYDRIHRRQTREYQRILEQRNALLRAMRDEGRSADELQFWDAELCRVGGAISARRRDAVEQLREPFLEALEHFGGDPEARLAYSPESAGSTAEERAAEYHAMLAEKREKELWQGSSLVGPHREDLALTVQGRDLPSFASRGEQRSAVLALKLAEAAWLLARTGEAPVFLLDDVLSELDPVRRDSLVRALPAGAQAVITAALPIGLPAALMASACVVQVPFLRRDES